MATLNADAYKVAEAITALHADMAPLADGSIALRHSNQPDGDIVLFTRAEINAWIKGCKAGEFDDLTT